MNHFSVVFFFLPIVKYFIVCVSERIIFELNRFQIFMKQWLTGIFNQIFLLSPFMIFSHNNHRDLNILLELCDTNLLFLTEERTQTYFVSQLLIKETNFNYALMFLKVSCSVLMILISLKLDLVRHSNVVSC